MADGSRPDRPALDIQLPATRPALQPRLDALLDDFDPFAIEETAGGRCRVYFFSARSRDEAARAIDVALTTDGASATPIDIPDDGWAERSQGGLEAVRVGDIVVAPPWDRPAPDDDAIVVEITPSTGFGTGHHATTRLCLSLMQRLRPQIAESRRVIDLGTGSGVLAIAAIRLGARHVSGLDRDPDALRNARHNMERNGVDHRTRCGRPPRHRSIELVKADLTINGASNGRADVVLANLTGTLFEQQADTIGRYVGPGGLLIASGFTEEEDRQVRAALGNALTLVARETEDNWVGAAFRRSGAGSPR
ncbi:MAG: methyltransferase domain-containing protein [Acidobacteria bacterium]|nr:methyltransferase domain-containing protein [Acidobacteriota bacterium]MYD71582.1 methyltransferase domain-containing protein [Acidobacteriota bacterium]MYJ06262.1 methyltransferase domain-containing protein [Acidobacteriota bacterium]